MRNLRLFSVMLVVLVLFVFPLASAAQTSYAYVANRRQNTVSVIDTSTNHVVAMTSGFLDGPYCIAITPDGTRAYVANNFGNSVSVIDTSSNTVVARVPVGSGPSGVAISPPR